MMRDAVATTASIRKETNIDFILLLLLGAGTLFGVWCCGEKLDTMTTNACCAECGKEEGGVSLKTCKPCMQVKYCNADCQKNHWPKHKKQCKQRAAELRDEALFKDPPPKEECLICFLPMPIELICCVSLPPATISSVPPL
jgi:hypothetical protein